MKRNKEVIIEVIFVSFLFLLTIGYAMYDQLLSLNSNIVLKKPGTLAITGVEVFSSNLPSNAGTLKLVNGELVLDYSFTVSQEEVEYEATYLITVDNGSPYDYNFVGFMLDPSVEVNDASGAVLTYEYTQLGLDDQVNVGDIIPSKESRIVAITIHFKVVSENKNTTIIVGGSAGVNTSADDSGTFYGGIVGLPINLDLTQEGAIKCFDVDVLNNYKSSQSYSFSLTNNNFSLVDIDGANIGSFTIPAMSEEGVDNEQRVQLCMKVNDGSVFASDTEKTQVVINPIGLSSFSVGTLTMSVTKTENIEYEGRPEIENVSFETVKYDQTSSSLVTKASWNRKDTDGLSIDNWYINLYSASDDSLITSFEVDGAENISNYELSIPDSILTSTNFTTALNNGSNFYIKVYGVDTAGNSGESYCGESTTYCVASDAISLKYQFTLTYSGTNVSMTNTTSSKTATIYLNNSFTSVISTTNTNYTLSGVRVVMGSGDTAKTFTNGTEYSYALQENSSTTADFSIFDGFITDDINVTVSSYNSGWECLIKGTKIKVYGGYKNIEDITYDDLLVVYSYELGREVYEYPIKIEVEGKTDYYQQITFSDGSILKTFGAHGIFSSDANKFVSVLDRENFHIGTKVFKDIGGKLVEVEVVNLEMIEEETTYYNISSTRYLNVIANGFITTDPILAISNIFSFDDNLMWGKDREDYLLTNDFIPYELLKDYFPKYLYDGIRMGEAKYLINQGIINVDEYVAKFSEMKFEAIPVDENGNNKWMVTTSLDLENNLKGSYYSEGSYYKLPLAKRYINKRFIGWYNTASNEIYKENDLVYVGYGMYFEAIYEDINLIDNYNFNNMRL